MNNQVFADSSNKKAKKTHSLMIIFLIGIVLLAGFLVWGFFQRPPTSDMISHRDSLVDDIPDEKEDEKVQIYGYHVERDANSFTSLQENIDILDGVFVEALRLTPDGIEEIESDMSFRTYSYLEDTRDNLPVFAHIVNYNSENGRDGELVNSLLSDETARSEFITRITTYVSTRQLDGVSIDFENLSEETWNEMPSFISDVSFNLKNELPEAKVYVNVPFQEGTVPYRLLENMADHLILMAYDEHRSSGEPGAIASETWFGSGLIDFSKVALPRNTLLAVGNYGYDRNTTDGGADSITRNQAQSLLENFSGSNTIDEISQNPTFTYSDEDGDTHEVWYLDAMTLEAQMDIAKEAGFNSFALWRLGSEDPSSREVVSKKKRPLQ